MTVELCVIDKIPEGAEVFVYITILFLDYLWLFMTEKGWKNTQINFAWFRLERLKGIVYTWQFCRNHNSCDFQLIYQYSSPNETRGLFKQEIIW